jgi:ubiquinone/menaquinone biosynthesis C-methylase UbiE
MANMNHALRAYDADAGRLVYYGGEANPAFWDEHWSGQLKDADVKRFNRDVARWTKRYLPKGARVLDAGCGTANTVWSLTREGFDAWGVDFASDTVEAVKRVAPELQVIQGDVRALPFESESMDGIWSLGVIEHFPEGYEKIVDEMIRVIRPKGYAFVTFPAMSPLRRLKAKTNAYRAFSGDYDGFYQFALDIRTVIRDFERQGLKAVATSSRGGFKGLKDEVRLPLLQQFYDSRSRWLRLIRGGLDRILAPLTCHGQLVVFLKP